MEYVVNPRRSPRAPVRCSARVVTAQGPLEAETEDLSAHGVQIVCPRELRRGDSVRVTLTHKALKEPLEVAGRVSWASPQEPWRAGIGFDDGSLRAAKRWYERLVQASPGLPSFDRVPERIAFDASVFLGAPPRFVLDFSPDEAVVLRAIGSGSTLDDLRVKLRDRWVPCQRAIFSLLSRSHVTLQRGEGVHPNTWQRILAELETSQALAELGSGATPPPGVEGGPGWPEEPVVPVDRAKAPPDPSRPFTTPAGGSPAQAGGARPATRSADAQECFDRGQAELAKGQIHTGVALLRRAAALSPGDTEITSALWKASASAASSRR
jgi:hypothetical protein